MHLNSQRNGRLNRYVLLCCIVSASVTAGFLLRFVKGGNKFAIAGGRHLVHVSHGMMGTKRLREEWKPNMAGLEVSIFFFYERKRPNKEQFLYRRWIFKLLILSAGCFYIIYKKKKTEIHKTRTSFFKTQ